MNFKRGERGFSLVEAMVAVGVLGITVTINSNFLGSHLKTQRSRDLVAKREELTDILKAAIVNPENIRASALMGGSPGNAMLAACINPFMTCPPAATDSIRQQSFALVNPRYISAGNQAFDIIAGTLASPRYYDKNLGNTIGTPGPNFPYAVSAYFWATCPIDMFTQLPRTTCNGANIINFRFQITADASLSEQIEYPKSALFFTGSASNHRFSQALSTKDITLSLSQTCNPGSVADGFTAEGKIKCRCLIQQIGVDANSMPICAASTCTPPTRMVGIVNGMPDCQNTAAIICDNRTGIAGRSEVDCGPGHWLKSLTAGTCNPDISSKKTAISGGIACSRDDYVCCRRNI